MAINTILERTGARCGLLTTAGFRDIYEIGRVNRPESYNLFFQKHVPLIPRALRREIRERVDAGGRVLLPLDDNEIREAAAALIAEGVEAIAILFLHSYRAPDHERRAKAIIAAAHPRLFVTASHELSQEYREFERTSTTAANAYIGPRVRRCYLAEDGGAPRGVALRRAAPDRAVDGRALRRRRGAARPASACSARPGGRSYRHRGAVRETAGIGNAIAFDMGGTTAKAGK